MVESATGSARFPVNAKGLKERMRVRTGWMHEDAQLRNFTPLKDRLLATGQDANARYLQIEAERDRLWTEWKQLAPTASSVPFPSLPAGAASSLPIAPLQLIGPGLDPWFGFSGSVQMGPAQEGENSIPPGVSGSIDTLPNGLLSNGSILFGGDLVTGGKAAIWLHNWSYLIVFPAPVMASVLTYSFGVGVQVTVLGGKGNATCLSFVALGESANFTGQEIGVSNDGYPLAENLGLPVTVGTLNVRRSFLVKGGEVPAVALMVGVAVALSADSEVALSTSTDCFICPAATIDPVTAVGPPAERGLVNFHYQPIIVNK
jgi:hypothetical protein